MSQVSAAQIRTDLEAIIRRIRPELQGRIESSDRLRDDLGLDSLHSMELLSEVSEKYHIDVDPENVQDVRTVGDVTAFLCALLAKEPGAA
ncbi:MAG TPA: acyl carrier protein [Polyangiaceae bacterium]|jgi:acyl carrier protein|nr:acyl carrier protein [Polyangiaceae bacterium]